MVTLSFKADSLAADAALVALIDLGSALASVAVSLDRTRVIGGQMVWMHVSRLQLGSRFSRQSLDTDVGFHVVTLRGIDISQALADLGYTRREGHRFAKPLPAFDDSRVPREAIIDVLIPSVTSRSGRTRRVGDIVSFETPGLADALNRTGLEVTILATHLDGQQRQTQLMLPDEFGALGLKVEAWWSRRANKDAIDVWRCLEICHAAKVGSCPVNLWETVGPKLESDFGARQAPGMRALIAGRGLSGEAETVLVTRTHALVRALVPNAGS